MKFPWTTLDTEVIAHTEHQKMSTGYNYGAENSVRKLTSLSLIDFQPNFHYVEFPTLCAHVDLISSIPMPDGWIVSERFLQLLQRHRLPPHRVYPLPVRQRNVDVSGYFFVHLPQLDIQLKDEYSISEAECEFRKREDFMSLDLIPLYRPSRFSYRFVSRELRDSIEAAKLTGMRFGTSRLFRTAVA